MQIKTLHYQLDLANIYRPINVPGTFLTQNKQLKTISTYLAHEAVHILRSRDVGKSNTGHDKSKQL